MRRKLLARSVHGRQNFFGTPHPRGAAVKLLNALVASLAEGVPVALRGSSVAFRLCYVWFIAHNAKTALRGFCAVCFAVFPSGCSGSSTPSPARVEKSPELGPSLRSPLKKIFKKIKPGGVKKRACPSWACPDLLIKNIFFSAAPGAL